MNNLLKVELNKMQSKIEPLQNSEMLLIKGGNSLTGGTDGIAWCTPLQDNCMLKVQKANRTDDLEQKIKF